MPIYAYRCAACGHDMEALQKISDEPLTDCPECGQSALRKQVTAAAFRLKGTGWYETDFKGDKKQAGADKKEGAKESAATDTEKKSKDSAGDGAKPPSESKKESTASSSAAKSST